MATKIILTNGNDKISGTSNADNFDALVRVSKVSKIAMS